MIDVRMPIRYEIEAEELHDGSWLLYYAEYHSKKNWDEAKSSSGFKLVTAITERMGVEVQFDETQRKAYYMLIGSKAQVFSALAAEFTAMAPFGDLTIKQLMILAAAGLIKGPPKEEVDILAGKVKGEGDE